MKQITPFLLFTLMATVCQAQELTKDGLGSLRWGGSVADAKQASPLLEEPSALPHESPSSETGKRLFDIPCDAVLTKPTKKGNVSLLFFDGQWIGFVYHFSFQEMPAGLTRESLETEVPSRVKNIVAGNPELQVKLHSLGTSGNKYVLSASFDIVVSHKTLAAEAEEKLNQKLKANAEGFFSDLIEEVGAP
jgi:hypothetical protein